MRLGATSSEICTAATAKRRSPSRSRTKDCEEDSTGWFILATLSLRQGVRPAEIQEPAKRLAEQNRRRSKNLRGLPLESCSDPTRSIRGTTPAPRGSRPGEATGGGSSWPSCRCHRPIERSASFEGRK